MGQKKVGFYRPVIIDEDETRREIEDDKFWVKTHAAIAAMDYNARRTSINTAPFHGEAGIGTSPALNYIRLGRVRYAADWPDMIDDGAQKIEALTLPRGRNLFECAYVVPFGTVNRVAFMGPLRGIVSLRQTEMWLGAMLDLPKKGRRLELLPEVDPAVMDKLVQAEGVTRVEVRVPVAQEFALAEGNPTGAEAALKEATEAAGEKLVTELVFSSGHGRADAKTRSKLKAAVQRLVRATGVDRLSVSMTHEHESDGKPRLVTSTHDLLRDIITSTAQFDVADHSQLEIDDVLRGIDGAIQKFRDGTP